MIVMQRRIFGHIRIQNSISKRRDINIMKKHTKVLAVLSTTAFMAAFAPNFLSNAPVSCVYAASAGWTQENGGWVFYDSDGDLLTDTWK